jgi:hypothetical protein
MQIVRETIFDGDEVKAEHITRNNRIHYPNDIIHTSEAAAGKGVG